MRVLIQTSLSPYSGYGNDGIGIARAFEDWGAEVVLLPTTVQPPLPEDVAQMLTRPVDGVFDLYINHTDPSNLAVTPDVKAVAKYTVGWTMWEYSNFKNLTGRSTLRKRLNGFDSVVAYDEISRGCLEPYVKGEVLTVQGGFWPQDWPEMERDWHSDRFGFCMVGALTERKDPFVAIKAFSELKQEFPEEFAPAELHLKTNTPGLHSGIEKVIDKVRIHYAVWPDEILRSFYAAQHCLLAPSRGEGKNMPALEF